MLTQTLTKLLILTMQPQTQSFHNHEQAIIMLKWPPIVRLDEEWIPMGLQLAFSLMIRELELLMGDLVIEMPQQFGMERENLYLL